VQIYYMYSSFTRDGHLLNLVTSQSVLLRTLEATAKIAINHDVITTILFLPPCYRQMEWTTTIHKSS